MNPRVVVARSAGRSSRHGASDGYVNGKSKIVDHGADSQRYNIVILGDGYTAAQISQFKSDVDTLVNTIRMTAPFNDLWCGVSVYRVDVVSTESGADDPSTCDDKSTGSGAGPRDVLRREILR